MRTKPPIKVKITVSRDPENKRMPQAGEVFEAYADPHRLKYYKVYRTFKTGRRDQRVILVPKKDCEPLTN